MPPVIDGPISTRCHFCGGEAAGAYHAIDRAEYGSLLTKGLECGARGIVSRARALTGEVLLQAILDLQTTCTHARHLGMGAGNAEDCLRALAELIQGRPRTLRAVYLYQDDEAAALHIAHGHCLVADAVAAVGGPAAKPAPMKPGKDWSPLAEWDRLHPSQAPREAPPQPTSPPPPRRRGRPPGSKNRSAGR